MTCHPTPDADALLARAAELRAGGTPWDAVADELDADPAHLKHLSREHRRAYRRHVAAARSDLLDDAFGEAVFSLRRQLRSPDDKTVGKASEVLAKVWMTRRRHRGKPAAPGSAPP